MYVMAMAVHDGKLFVGTCEAGPGGAGHVYRYDGGSRWVDCGRPDRSNAVTSLGAFGGKLYAGTGRYRLAGSALTESTNVNLGGKIVRYDGDGNWADCGRLPDTEAVGGMAVFRGELYASSLYKPAGFFRYRLGDSWHAAHFPPTAVGSSPSASSMDTSTRGRMTPVPSVGSTARAGRPRRPGVDRPDLLIRSPPGRVVRRDLAERASLPVRPGQAVRRGGPARGGKRGHGDGRPQRQTLRRDAPARGGLSLR